MDGGKTCVLLVSGAGGAEVAAALRSNSVEAELVTGLDAAGARLESRLFHAVWLWVDEATRADVARLSELCGDVPIVAVGREDEALMRGVMASGAAEYLAWPASPAALALTLEAIVARGRGDESATTPNTGASDLLGGSPQMKTVRATLERVAGGMATVLVRGETGTGKELVARGVHAQSPRSRGPFVKVHAPAVPDALLESELFGYEKGAFTGATMRKPGRVELAEGGTLFLDEIGDVSPVMQAKLLRLIQDREYERLGGTRTLRADVRFVAATHRDLEHMVETGAFREDLFYRLNVVTLWLPPLRARRDDIESIARYYLQHFRLTNGKPQLQLEDSALRLLLAERWPGNVRQLVNFVERLVVLARGDVVTAADVRTELEEQLAFMTQAAPLSAASPPLAVGLPLRHGAEAPVPAANAPPVAEASGLSQFSSAVRPLKEDMRRAEYRAIIKALASANGNRAQAARLLGVSRRTLYTKLDEHGIE